MTRQPTFAFLTIGSGSYLGSTVRDVTLANSLHRRGFKVVVYWMMEWKRELVDEGIQQRLLCHGIRYHFKRPSEFLDRVIGPLLFLVPLRSRVRFVQRLTGYVDRLLENLVRSLHATPDADRSLVKRLRKYIAEDEVSHLMLSFGSIGPLALAARKNGDQAFDYLVTFQGDEEFAAYARRAGLLADYRQRLDEVVRGSPWPAIAVSHDYLNRMVDEIGLAPAQLRVVYNGVELSKRDGRDDRPPFSILSSVFPNLRQGTAIVSYVGRQESEKGIDLLLYAAKLLDARQIPLQLVICGSTAKGETYQKVIADLAGHLRLRIHHRGSVSPEVRDALYAHSRCVVCSSVNREPFGLVVAEAMSHGTPVLVPDCGGVAEVIRQGEKFGGLTFKTWDSGDIARQLERLLTDEALHSDFAGNTRAIAARFGAEQMTDRVLEHVGVYAGKDAAESAKSRAPTPELVER